MEPRYHASVVHRHCSCARALRRCAAAAAAATHAIQCIYRKGRDKNFLHAQRDRTNEPPDDAANQLIPKNVRRCCCCCRPLPAAAAVAAPAPEESETACVCLRREVCIRARPCIYVGDSDTQSAQGGTGNVRGMCVAR